MQRTLLSRATSLALFLLLGSCASPGYFTPTEPVDLDAISDHGVRAAFAAEPLASYPAHVALVRVQADRVRGGWRPITGIETLHVIGGARTGPIDPDHVERLAALPGVVDAVAPNALLMNDAELRDLDDLRDEVAPLRPDLLVVYTLDTRVDLESDAFGFVDLLTLGVLLEDRRYLSCTASALVVDVKSGFVWSSLDARAEAEESIGRWFPAPPDAETLEGVEAEAVASLVDLLAEGWSRLGARVEEAALARSAATAASGGATGGVVGGGAARGHVIEVP